MQSTRKAIEEKTTAAWAAYLSTLEHALVQMEKSIADSVSVPTACTNEWCESVEEVIEELTDAVYALKTPRWADAEQAARVRALKKKARAVHAAYVRAAP